MRIHGMSQALDRARIRHASSVNSVLTFNCELALFNGLTLFSPSLTSFRAWTALQHASQATDKSVALSGRQRMQYRRSTTM